MGSDDFSDGYYEPAEQEIRQGDLLSGITWGPVVHPLTICRPKNASLDVGVSDYAPPAALKGPPPAFDNGRLELAHAKVRSGFGIVMWQDCQIDYLKNRGRAADSKALVAIAPVVPFSEVPATIHEGIRSSHRPGAFYLPSCSELQKFGLEGEAYVDLRHTVTVYQRALGERTLSLSRTAVKAFYDHIFWFLTAYRASGPLNCPSCGVAFELPTPFEGAPVE